MLFWSETFAVKESDLNVGIHSDIYKPVWFKLCMMIDTAELVVNVITIIIITIIIIIAGA